MIRYVFLIPPGMNGSRRGGIGYRRIDYIRQMTAGRQPGEQSGQTTLPPRSQIKTQMIENMENIEARIERRRIER
jgi:hypothetical protein